MEIEKELLSIISQSYSKSFERIIHSINQLDDGRIWRRPSSSSNSIGIIIRHLNGNLNQWVCSAVGGEEFQRNRSMEFEDPATISKDVILQMIKSLDKHIQDILKQVPSESLLSYRRIQGFDESVLSAIIKGMTHLDLHSGQITFLTKLMLDKQYDTYWQPSNKEQGK